MTDPTAPVLEVRDLRKTYRSGDATLEVLRGVDFRLARGGFVSIVGQSGSGKSTLLHLMGLLDPPDSGAVLLDGERIDDLPAGRRDRLRNAAMGMVFQAYHLLPELDVLENVILPTMALGAPAAGVRERALELLKAVGLADRWHHMPLELSGGEQQRVALARALMNDPEILLADEPTGSLDSKTGAQVLEQLFALADIKSRTLIVVTHNTDVAAACTRIIRMKDGRIEP